MIQAKPQIRVFLTIVLSFVLLWLAIFSIYSLTTGKPAIFVVSSSVVFFLYAIIFVSIFRAALHKIELPLKTQENRDQPFSFKRKFKADSIHETQFLSQTYEEALSQLKVKHDELVNYQIQLDQRASSAEAFSQHIINDLPVGLIAFDINGYIKIINSPAEQIFDFLPGLATDQFLGEIFQNTPFFVENIKNILNENLSFQKFEIELKNASGVKLLEISVAPLIIKNKISGAISLISDVTEITALREQALTQRNLESLGIMAAGIAHEFKNSLATFNGYAQFLNRQATEETAQKASTALIQEVRKFSEMITAFLNFARPQPLTKSHVNLEVLFIDCIKELTLSLSQSPIKINLAGNFPIIQADSQMLRQAIINLLRNAVEATLEATVKHPVLIECSQYKDENSCLWATIEIRDRGVGIQKDDLQFIFVPFFTTKKQGHGIGLALAHRIIDSHGGTLIAANNVDRGAVLTIKLKI